jgi:hypothetical protein
VRATKSAAPRHSLLRSAAPRRQKKRAGGGGGKTAALPAGFTEFLASYRIHQLLCAPMRVSGKID